MTCIAPWPRPILLANESLFVAISAIIIKKCWQNHGIIKAVGAWSTDNLGTRDRRMCHLANNVIGTPIRGSVYVLVLEIV